MAPVASPGRNMGHETVRRGDGAWITTLTTLALLSFGGHPVEAQGQSAAAEAGKASVSRTIETGAEGYGALAQDIWDLAELGYLEVESSALLMAELRAADFRIEEGVVGMPTAITSSVPGRWRRRWR